MAMPELRATPIAVLQKQMDDANQRCDALHREMSNLAFLSAQLPEHRAYLAVHVRRTFNSHRIRWRIAGTHQHAVWGDVQQLIKGMSKSLRQWHIDVNCEADILNMQYKAQRLQSRYFAEMISIIEASKK
jgi:hypothetical protein